MWDPRQEESKFHRAMKPKLSQEKWPMLWLVKKQKNSTGLMFTSLKLLYPSVEWAKEDRAQRFNRSPCGRNLLCTVAIATSTKGPNAFILRCPPKIDGEHLAFVKRIQQIEGFVTAVMISISMKIQ